MAERERRGCKFHGFKVDPLNKRMEAWPFIDPATGKGPEQRKEWEVHCPLSIVDEETVGMIELTRRIDSGQIVLQLESCPDYPPIFWDMQDYVHLCDRKLREETCGH